MYENLNIHARHENILNILNGLELQGYREFTVIAPVIARAMKELIVLDQAMYKEEEQKLADEEARAKAAEKETKGSLLAKDEQKGLLAFPPLEKEEPEETD